MQLQEIRLYDGEGALIDVEALASSGAVDFGTNGNSPNSHGLENLFDADVSQ